MPLKDALHRLLRSEKFKFLLVGGFNVANGYCLFAVLFLIFGRNFHYLAIGIVTHFLAVTVAFYAYRFFVVRDSRGRLASYLRFHLVNLANLGLSVAGLTFLVEFFGLYPLVAQAVVTAVVVALSFVLHKRFSFAS